MFRSNLALVLVLVVAVIASVGVAVFLAYSSEGEIAVDDRIRAIDPSTLSKEVNTATTPEKPNGGLNPQQGAPVEPAPQAQPPEVSASSTATTTGEASASDTPDASNTSPQ
jgi:hypothetical protein